jgi:hypothetical protein
MNRLVLVPALALAASIPSTADAGSTCVAIVVATTSTQVRVSQCVSTPGDVRCVTQDLFRPPTYVAVTICVPVLPAPPPPPA